MRIAVPTHAVAAPGDTAPQTAPARAVPISQAAQAPVPALRLERLLIESDRPLVTGAIERGFREAWREHAPGVRWQAVSPATFARELAIAGLASADGYELGRRIAKAIVDRAAAARAGR